MKESIQRSSLFYLRQKQSSNTHPKEECGLWGVFLNEARPSEVISISYIGQFFGVFVFLWPIILFYVLPLTRPRALPDMCAYRLVKMDSKTKHGGKVI